MPCVQQPVGCSCARPDQNCAAPRLNRYQTKFEEFIHPNTGQTIVYVDPLLRVSDAVPAKATAAWKAACCMWWQQSKEDATTRLLMLYRLTGLMQEGNNTGLRNADCSNGDRSFYLEYLQPPTMGGKYAWHPCMTQWLPDQLASASITKQAQLKELCWYKVTEEVGLHTRPKMSASTKLPADAPNLDTQTKTRAQLVLHSCRTRCEGAGVHQLQISWTGSKRQRSHTPAMHAAPACPAVPG